MNYTETEKALSILDNVHTKLALAKIEMDEFNPISAMLIEAKKILINTLSPAPAQQGKTDEEIIAQYWGNNAGHMKMDRHQLRALLSEARLSESKEWLSKMTISQISALPKGKTETKESESVDFLHYVLNLEGGSNRAVSKSLCEEYYQQFKNKK